MDEGKEVQCIHQPGDGVRCTNTTRCATCGWNPEVASRRLAKFLETTPRPCFRYSTWEDKDASGLVDED